MIPVLFSFSSNKSKKTPTIISKKKISINPKLKTSANPTQNPPWFCIAPKPIYKF